MKSAKREMKCFALNCKCFNYFLICDQDSFVIVNANWSLFKFTKFTTSKRNGDIKKVIEKKCLNIALLNVDQLENYHWKIFKSTYFHNNGNSLGKMIYRQRWQIRNWVEQAKYIIYSISQWERNFANAALSNAGNCRWRVSISLTFGPNSIKRYTNTRLIHPDCFVCC